MLQPNICPTLVENLFINWSNFVKKLYICTNKMKGLNNRLLDYKLGISACNSAKYTVGDTVCIIATTYKVDRNQFKLLNLKMSASEIEVWK